MGKKMGRPRKEIDKDAFENLCKIQCTEIEICSVLGVSDKTLDKWCRENYKSSEDGRKGLTFSEVFPLFKAQGRISIRRKQFALATGSARMAIWLGKQYLDQKDPDKVESKPTNVIDNFIKAVQEKDENGGD